MRTPLTALLATIVLAGCGASSAPSGPTVGVSAGDNRCELTSESLTAGPARFAVVNSGKAATDVSIVAKRAVIGHANGVPAGGTRTFTARLPTGVVELVCRPVGSSGAIRAVLTVGPARM